MKKLPALLFVIFLFANLSITAQPNKKISPALAHFNNTDFMLKFNDLAVEAQATTQSIIENKQNFSQGDLRRLRTSYDQTVHRANNILTSIKQDFLDKKKLKVISEYPEMYSEGLQLKLNDLSDFYGKNFQQTLADAGGMEEDGSAILLLVTELIGLTKGLIDYYNDIKKEAKKYNESYLNAHFYEPSRWKFWDELAIETSPETQVENTDWNENDWNAESEEEGDDESTWDDSGDWDVEPDDESLEVEDDWGDWDVEALDTLNHRFKFEDIESKNLKKEKTTSKSSDGQ